MTLVVTSVKTLMFCRFSSDVLLENGLLSVPSHWMFEGSSNQILVYVSKEITFYVCVFGDCEAASDYWSLLISNPKLTVDFVTEVRPVHCSQMGGRRSAQSWRELVSLWSGPITPTPRTRSELTRVAVSPCSTHTSTRTKQQAHWGDYSGPLWVCIRVYGNIKCYAWLCLLVVGLGSRQRPTVRWPERAAELLRYWHALNSRLSFAFCRYKSARTLLWTSRLSSKSGKEVVFPYHTVMPLLLAWAEDRNGFFFSDLMKQSLSSLQ